MHQIKTPQQQKNNNKDQKFKQTNIKIKDFIEHINVGELYLARNGNDMMVNWGQMGHFVSVFWSLKLGFGAEIWAGHGLKSKGFSWIV